MDENPLRNLMVHGALLNRSRKVPLSKQELEKLYSYLENPTKQGIWTLTTKWNKFGGISDFIRSRLSKILKKEFVSIQDKKLKLKKEEKIELLENTGRFTFIFNLFTYLLYLEKNDDSFASYLQFEDQKYKLAFDLLDLEEIKKEYALAYDFFKEHIYFKEFNPVVKFGKFLRIKTGFYVIEDDNYKKYDFNPKDFDEENFGIPEAAKRPAEEKRFISIDPEPLEKIKKFYELLGKLSDSIIMPTHSPEEEVFAPYFVFLEQTYHSFINNEGIREKFKKSINEYEEENYPYCISTIGIIIEDYLTQIYETLFTEICPKDLTLGELFDIIHSRVNKLFKKQVENAPESNPIYEKIKIYIERKNQDEQEVALASLIRDVLSFSQKSQKYVLDVIELRTTKSKQNSIFPSNLIDNIKEAIRNRNATSHKSTYLLGKYEALRTVYCCITLILWWNAERQLLNWKVNPEERIKQSVERNNISPN